MKFSNPNIRQKVALTVTAVTSIILLLFGLVPTLFRCIQSNSGIVCGTGQQEYTPLLALILAYSIAELSLLTIGMATIMWSAGLGGRSKKVSMRTLLLDFGIPIAIFLAFMAVLVVIALLMKPIFKSNDLPLIIPSSINLVTITDIGIV